MNQCKGDCEVTFENANGIFVKKGYSILNEFSLICNNYKTEFSELESVAQVNNWINKKTNGKIPSVLPHDYKITNVNLMLVNAIYFKGSWEHKFEEKTIKREFKILIIQKFKLIQYINYSKRKIRSNWSKSS